MNPSLHVPSSPSDFSCTKSDLCHTSSTGARATLGEINVHSGYSNRPLFPPLFLFSHLWGAPLDHCLFFPGSSHSHRRIVLSAASLLLSLDAKSCGRRTPACHEGGYPFYFLLWTCARPHWESGCYTASHFSFWTSPWVYYLAWAIAFMLQTAFVHFCTGENFVSFAGWCRQ